MYLGIDRSNLNFCLHLTTFFWLLYTPFLILLVELQNSTGEVGLAHARDFVTHHAWLETSQRIDLSQRHPADDCYHTLVRVLVYAFSAICEDVCRPPPEAAVRIVWLRPEACIGIFRVSESW